MMMNSILGTEPAAGGKAMSAAKVNSNKSDSSGDFSDYMTTQSGQSEEFAEARVSDGESPVSEAAEETEAKSAGTAGNEESSTESEEKTDLSATSEGSSDADAENAASLLEQAYSNVPDVTELAGQAQAEGELSAAHSSETADAIESTNTAVGQALQKTAIQEAAHSTGKPGANAANTAALGDAKPVTAGRQASDSQFSGLPESGMRAEAAQPQEADRATHSMQELNSVKRKEAFAGSTETVRGNTDAKKAISAENAGSRSQMGIAVHKGTEVLGDVRGSESIGVALAGKTVSGKPNELAVEQMTARQPEGVTRAVAAGAQGAVQTLASGVLSPRESSRNSDLGSVSIKVSEDISAEALAEGKQVVWKPRTGQINTVPAAQAAPQASAMFQPLVASGLAETAGAADLPFHALGLSGEAPGLSQILTEASFGAHSVHRPEMPRMIAAQIAEAFAAKGEQKVEVSLNPQELGHVKMRVVTSENGITMIIQTERPETGDLMRRHINELAEEFRRMGYEDISFEFSGGQAGSGGDGDGTDESAGHDGGAAGSRTDGAEAAGEQAIQNLRLGSAGVDMRV